MKFIFEVKVKSDYSVEEYIEAWEGVSKIIQQLEGAQGTRLHQKLGEERVFLAIAEWRSNKAREKAMAKLEEIKKRDESISSIFKKFNEMGEFKKIGNYEDSKWSVFPK